MKHSPPSRNKQHLTFRKIAGEAGFSDIQIREFLWLLNAHESLIAFRHVCDNLSHVLQTLKSADICLEEHGISGWPVITAWVKHNQSLLRKHFPPYVSLILKSNQDARLSKKGLVRHGMYCLLCNVQEHGAHRERYILLIGRLLLAHIEAMRRFIPIDIYESYEGDEEILEYCRLVSISSDALSVARGDENQLNQCRPIYQATHAMRLLSYAKNTPILLAFAPDLPTDDFYQHLQHLRPTHLKANFPEHHPGIWQYISALRSFLLNSNTHKVPKLRPADTTGWRGGGGKMVPGYLGLMGEDALIYDLGDEDDPYFNWGSQEVVVETITPCELSEEDLEAIEEDVDPSELADNTEIALTEYDCKETKRGVAGLAFAARAQVRHRSMANQTLPWAYPVLTIQEVARLLGAFENRWNVLKKIRDWTEEQKLEAEAIIATSICFWLGADLEAVHGLHLITKEYHPKHPPLAVFEKRFQPPRSPEYEWRRKSISPEHFQGVTDPETLSRQRHDFVYLPDLVGFTDKFNSLRSKSQQGDKTAFFPTPLETLKQTIRALADNTAGCARVTIKKIESFLFHRILEHSGDVSVAAAITGKKHWLNNVRAFYFTPSFPFLRDEYIATVGEVVNDLHRVAPDLFPAESVRPTLMHEGHHVGSRLCPRMETVIEAISRLKEAVASRPLSCNEVEKIRDYHNLYTLYTVLMFGFSTACRAIITPLLPTSAIDTESGLAVLADKETRFRNKSRALWIPSFVWQQLQNYEHHCTIIRKSFALQAADTSESTAQTASDARGEICFFVSTEGRAELVRPKLVAQHAAPYLPFPANVHRRFLRTILIERHCPPEIVDAWMGHWSTGQSPWGAHSSLAYWDYRTTLQSHLLPLLDELGLIPIATHLEADIWTTTQGQPSKISGI